MSVEHDASAALDALRDDLAPTESDRARILAALEARLAAGNSERAPRDDASAVRSRPAMRGNFVARPALRLTRLVGMAVLLCGTGAIFGWTAWRAAKLSPSSAPSPLSHAVSKPELVVPAAPANTSSASPDTPQFTDAPVPRTVAPKVVGKRSRTRAAAPSSQAAVANAQVAPLPAASLRPELDALQRAERALRDGRPELALEILRACDREVGKGTLQQERAAAEFVARCALTPQPRPDLFSEFTRAYPHSAYAERVRRSCALR